ncbi:putative hydroquinone glucosyltransferase [Dioscorea sansibarensis]
MDTLYTHTHLRLKVKKFIPFLSRSPAMAENSKPSHIAFLCGFGIGHLYPVSVFARHLIKHHNLTITIITQSIGSPSHSAQSLINSLHEEMNIISIPSPPPHSFPNTTNVLSLILFTMNYNLPHLRTILNSLTSATLPLKALALDFIYDKAILDLAEEFGIKPYAFYASPCIALSFCFHWPDLDAMYVGKFTDMVEPLRMPGCPPIQGKDFPDPTTGDRESEVYVKFLSAVKSYHKLKGIMVNSYEKLEPGIFKALKEDKNIPPLYQIGPLVRSCKTSNNDQYCIKWLDEQQQGSVLYVSFGSGGTLTDKQTKELALGLELSQQRFLWVVRRPHEKADACSFAGQVGMGDFDLLPQGFLERTKDLGLVVPSWAPQTQVLAHASTGGFLTHCGWNSTLESIVHGVPLIAWPLYAEQKMNAVMLVEDVKVALRPNEDETGLVGREEIARVIKCLMEGDEGKKLRQRVQVLRSEAANALEEEGSSCRSIKALVCEWNGL